MDLEVNTHRRNTVLNIAFPIALHLCNSNSRLTQTIEPSYEHLDTAINEQDQAACLRLSKSRISRYNVVHHLEKRRLLIAINCIAGLAIFFFGYDQGMMGGVNNAQDYYDTAMHFGYKDPRTGAVMVTNAVLQGAIVRITR